MAENIAALIKKHFPRKIFDLLKKIGRLATEQNFSAYGVGGFIRDIFLGRKNLDLDITIEGDGLAFSKFLSEKLKAQSYFYPKYLTAYLILADGLRLDVATARAETYPAAAAMPQVQPSSIEKDLFRRDFTVNAIAVALRPQNFGFIYDPFDGQEDIRKKIIRVLHSKSFLDDPTRIYRAIRFAGRYRFNLEKETRNLIADALARDLLSLVSVHRLRDELQAILAEDKAEQILQELEKLRALKYFSPNLKIVSPWPKSKTAQERLKFLLQSLSLKEKRDFLLRLGWPKKERSEILK